MPIPQPNNNENRDDFIKRCTSFLIDEGTSSDQAYAICLSQWENSKECLMQNKMKYIRENDLIKK